MQNFREILSAFPAEREEKLRAIKRFSRFEIFFYRSSLWHHSLRVAFLTAELSALAERVLPGYDAEKAFTLALVHDDAEILTGDIQAGYKKLMNKTELQKLDENEAAAIEVLSKKFPETISNYSYKELLYHALRKDCVEAQLVSFADKIDAYCESMHEILGGNILALQSVIFYVNAIPELKKKYTLLEPLFEKNDSPLINPDIHTDPWRVHRNNYADLNKPHTPESIRRETEFVFYNVWRKLVLKNLGQEGMEILTTQVEKL